MNNKYLRMAMSYLCDHKFEDNMDYHLCAVIVRGGSVVSVGYNKNNNNAFVEHYTDIARGQRDWCMSTHAEMDAVLKARGKTDLKGCKIFVVRRRKIDGEPGIARPCEICQHILFNYGIRKATYSVSAEEFGQMKIVNPATVFDKKMAATPSPVESSFSDVPVPVV